MHWTHLWPWTLDWLLATWYCCIFKHILLCVEHFSGHGLRFSGSALGCVARLHLRDRFHGKMMTSFCHSFKRASLFWIASNSDQWKSWNVPKRCPFRASTHKGWRLHHNYSLTKCIWLLKVACRFCTGDFSTMAAFYDSAETSEYLGRPFCNEMDEVGCRLCIVFRSCLCLRPERVHGGTVISPCFQSKH